MPSHTIFYSWQSDLPNSVNRGFIEDCLRRAIKELQDDETVELDPCLDRDTSGVPGSPDIASTIFAKIDNADIVVADVSFIDPEGTSRRCPNPNVLVELGYAAGRLSWERIICVFNHAYGAINDLPFDIRPRRVRKYELREGQEKAEQRRLLVSILKDDITAILHAPDQEEAAAREHFLSELGAELIRIIIFGSELDDRQLNPWLDSLRHEFSASADGLRRLAANDIAIQTELSAALDELARMLDDAAHRRFYPANWPEISELVEQGVDRAKAIKAEHFDGLSLSDESLAEVRAALLTTHRQLAGLAGRAPGMLALRLDDLQSEASQIGYTLLQFTFYNVNRLLEGLAERLRPIGHELHVVETMRVSCDGGRSAGAVVECITENNRRLGDLVDQMPPKR